MTIAETLAAHATARPSAPALVGHADWATFHARACAAASRFGAHRGRVVALALSDGPLLATLLVGCVMSGAIAFALPPAAPEPERERALAGLDVAALITPDDAERWTQPGAGGFTPPADDAVALLVGTSGTTGRPKRVALSYGGLGWNAAAHAESVGLAPGAVSLSLSPLYHAFPFVAVVLGTLLKGGAVAWLPGLFTPRAFFKEVAASGVGYAALPPTLLALLMERSPEAAGLPGVLSVGAAPMTPEALQAAVRWAASGGARLYHTYGLSEAGPRVSTLAPEDAATHADSVGRVLPGVEVRIVAGEVWLRSPSRMRGYYPDLDGLGPDGWLPTGDLGFVDAEGFLHLRGRAKEIIVTGGVSVSAIEIEEALLAHPAVEAVAVVPQASEAYGEVPRAHVVLRETLSREELLIHLMTRLSRHKLPHAIVYETQLPTTALGKVDKRKLKEDAC